ncbi:hypothetical protein PR202_gb27711 [Eleusine coracana subsp. coracana]|uniref:Pollen-specific protein SF21 n=1 Tax=Eleusine coracana subsp. coracana TaxID=191504 RepID=A0AAV5FSM7_ELECO|nr:hypothetical protein PR202_gb27711 [Eleusine coracana subsp. coracana]
MQNTPRGVNKDSCHLFSNVFFLTFCSCFLQEHHIQTNHGSVSVAIYGDHEKPALITYPDIALNHMSCFQGLLFCPEAASLLLHNFCIYHISPPGHELGAAPILASTPVPSADDLADQVSLLARTFLLSSRQSIESVYKDSSSFHLYVKLPHGQSGFIIREYMDALLNLNQILCRLAEVGIWNQYILTRCRRKDLTENLKQLQCRTLIFVGENSQFHAEAVHMTAKLDRRYSALVEVQACGSVVTEEQPHAMLIPMEYFLMGYGLYRPSQINCSPRSPLNPFCISPELLSPESMGVKLKPIKTRANLNL